MDGAAPWIPKVGLWKSQLLLLYKPGGSFLATALKPPSSQRGVTTVSGRVRIRTQVRFPEGGLRLLLTGLLQGEEHTDPIRRCPGCWQIPQPKRHQVEA